MLCLEKERGKIPFGFMSAGVNYSEINKTLFCVHEFCLKNVSSKMKLSLNLKLNPFQVK